MNFQECDVAGHEDYFLQLVCVEQTCPKRGLICSMCQFGDHQKHQTIPFRLFLESYKTRLEESKKTGQGGAIGVAAEQIAQRLARFKDSVAELVDRALAKFREELATAEATSRAAGGSEEERLIGVLETEVLDQLQQRGVIEQLVRRVRGVQDKNNLLLDLQDSAQRPRSLQEHGGAAALFAKLQNIAAAANRIGQEVARMLELLQLSQPASDSTRSEMSQEKSS